MRIFDRQQPMRKRRRLAVARIGEYSLVDDVSVDSAMRSTHLALPGGEVIQNDDMMDHSNLSAERSARGVKTVRKFPATNPGMLHCAQTCRLHER